MKKFLTLLTALLVTAGVTAFAQGYSVKGVISDQNGPVIGATVREQGTSRGTTTDQDGAYSLTVSSPDAIVEISCIGYTTVSFKAGELPQILPLSEDNEFLDEVVVIGYGEVRKTDLTGSVIAIKPSEINRVKMTTTTDLLLGKVAGLQITQGSGSPGSSGTVRIRQGASLNASNEPLVVIDGMVEQSLSSINPADIESISVLKDASASAIYGSRGANGVIIVTTKKGPSGGVSAPKVTYQGDFSVNQNYRWLDVYSADEFRTEYAKRGWDVSKLDTADTDWQKAIMRTAYTHKHTVSLAGATRHLPYRVSLGYQNEQGTIIGHSQQVGTATINLNPSFLDKHLTFNVGAKGTYKYTPNSGGSISSAARKDPTQPIYKDYGPVTIDGVNYDKKAEGFFMYGADDQGNNAEYRAVNPVAEAVLAADGGTKSYRMVTNATAVYKVHGFEDLSATVSFNGNFHKSDYDYRALNNTPVTWGSDNVALGYGGIGKNNTNNSKTNHYNMDYYLNYAHDFGKHAVSAMLGHSYESTHYEYWESATHYNNGDLEAGSVESSSNYDLNLASWFGRFNYAYDNRYLFTFTMRADASSRFAPETRWGYFPSGAFAWKISEEPWMKGVGAVSDLKLRLSYGKTGQQDIGSNYAYQAAYYGSTDQFMYREGKEFFTTYRPAAFDRTIQWEVTSTKNIGLDFGFFKNRISGTVDYYDRYTTNLLMEQVKVAAGSNFALDIDQNIGEMASSGFEFAINAIPVSTRDWNWTISANFAYNKSTIKKLTAYESKDAYVTTGAMGSSRKAQVHKVDETPYTYFLAKQYYDENGEPQEKFYNPSYDPTDPSSSEYVTDDAANSSKFVTGKSSLVPYYGGLSTQVTYKNWDFGLNAHYAFGQYVFWNTACSSYNNSFFEENYQFPTNYYKDVAPYWSKQHHYSDHWLYKGDYLKIDNVVLGYTFYDVFKCIDSLRASFGIQNLYTFTKYPGLDPEVYSGIDSSSVPMPRMYMFSLNINF